ncbi:MAG: hypothetical protein ACLGGV_07135 [Bacteroidia bacterium]
MKTHLRVLIYFSLCLVTSSCVLFIWSTQSKLKHESREKYSNYLTKLNADTTYSCQIISADSLSIKTYALYNYKIEKGTPQSREQIKIYDRNGKLYYGYDLCWGLGMFFEMLDSVPFKKDEQHFCFNMNSNVSLFNDINLINCSGKLKQNIIEKSKNHQFTILLSYTISSGILSKTMIKDINKHIKDNSIDAFIIYMNTSP